MPTSFPTSPDVLTVPAGTTPTAFDTWAKTVSDGLPAVQSAFLTRLVAFATTGNVSIASGLVAGTVIDGVTTVAGTVGLVKNQTLPEENGLYVVPASGSAVRHAAADSADDLRALKVLVAGGTVNAGRSYWLSSPRTGTLTVGTTGLTFAEFAVAAHTQAASTVTTSDGTLEDSLALKANVGAAVTLSQLPAGSMFTKKHNGAVWETRDTTRTDLVCTWIKRDSTVADPPIDATYMLNGVDILHARIA